MDDVGQDLADWISELAGLLVARFDQRADAG